MLENGSSEGGRGEVMRNERRRGKGKEKREGERGREDRKKAEAGSGGVKDETGR